MSDIIDNVVAEYRRLIADLKAENEKLWQELAKAHDPQRIGGQADQRSFVYAIEQLREFRWQHATNDEDAIPYINNVAAAHERENARLRNQVANLIDYIFRTADKMDCLSAENAKLRELVRTFYHCTTSGVCDECPINDGGPVYLMPDTICDTIHARMRELGVD